MSHGRGRHGRRVRGAVSVSSSSGRRTDDTTNSTTNTNTNTND
jgi:hypothetical protein